MSGTSADGKGNIKDVPAEEIVAQMLSGDESAPVIQAIGAFHNTQFTPDFKNLSLNRAYKNSADLKSR